MKRSVLLFTSVDVTREILSTYITYVNCVKAKLFPLRLLGGIAQQEGSIQMQIPGTRFLQVNLQLPICQLNRMMPQYTLQTRCHQKLAIIGDERDIDMGDSDSASSTSDNDEHVDADGIDTFDRSNLNGTQKEVPDNFGKLDAMLQLVEMKAQNGFSIKAFEQIVNWGREIHGYENRALADHKEAKCYWICLDSSHPCNYSLMDSKDDNCRYCGKQGTVHIII